MMKPTHPYNLNLDSKDLDDEMSSDPQNLLDALQPVLKQLNSFTASAQFSSVAQELSEKMKRDSQEILSKISEVVVVPMQPIIEAMQKQMHPFDELGKRITRFAIPPVLDLPAIKLGEVSVPSTATRPTEPVYMPSFRGAEPVIKLPVGAIWEKLKCRFKNAHTLTVLYDGKKVGDYSHEELGFAMLNSTKHHKPDKQWVFITFISIVSVNEKLGIRPTTPNVSQRMETSKDAVHKIKRSLSKKLQDAFGIDDDPFLSYDKHLGYRLKFVVEPEPDLRDRKLYPSGGSLEISEKTHNRIPKKNTKDFNY